MPAFPIAMPVRQSTSRLSARYTRSCASIDNVHVGVAMTAIGAALRGMRASLLAPSFSSDKTSNLLTAACSVMCCAIVSFPRQGRSARSQPLMQRNNLDVISGMSCGVGIGADKATMIPLRLPMRLSLIQRKSLSDCRRLWHELFC